MRFISGRRLFLFAAAFTAISLLAAPGAQQAPSILDAGTGLADRVLTRMAIASAPAPRGGAPVGAMTPDARRAAVDATWGAFPPEVSLEIFDRFWDYVDRKFAAFQGIDVDWQALRDRYRPEVAAGVSRGRLAAIVNHMSLALRDGHTVPIDLLVNFFSLPEPGVPLVGVGGWTVDTSGACMTAQDDGSALVYDVRPGHPLGLQRGDRVLGYDGVPWPVLYQQLLDEELPLWPLWWGSGPEGYEHTFVMSAGLNWHLFDTMDIYKQATGSVVHVPTSLMPGVIFSNFCSEQMRVAGVSKPGFTATDLVRWGVLDGTRIGYIYVWGWFGNAVSAFAAAVDDLKARGVTALIIDFRFNVGGFLGAPFTGLAKLFEHPAATIGMDERMRPDDHLKMQSFTGLGPASFTVDFESFSRSREKSSFAGPIAVLVGPGAISAGDFSTIWAGYHPNVRIFGKSPAMAAGLPTQPALGTELNLHPEWSATIAETNTYRVGKPHDYLIHTDLVVDERVWLRPEDVAIGKDTVVEAARRWIGQ